MSSRRNRYPTAGPIQTVTPPSSDTTSAEHKSRQKEVVTDTFQSNITSSPQLPPKPIEERVSERVAEFDQNYPQSNLNFASGEMTGEFPENGNVYAPAAVASGTHVFEGIGTQQPETEFSIDQSAQLNSFFNGPTTASNTFVSENTGTYGYDQSHPHYEHSDASFAPTTDSFVDGQNSFFNPNYPSSSAHGQSTSYASHGIPYDTNVNYDSIPNTVPYEMTEHFQPDFGSFQQFDSTNADLSFATNHPSAPDQFTAEYTSTFLPNQAQYFNPFGGANEYSQGNGSVDQAFLLPHPMHPTEQPNLQPSFTFATETSIHPSIPQETEANLQPPIQQPFEVEPIQLVSQQLKEAILSPPLQPTLVNCVSCNYANESQANFCCKCGTKLSVPMQPPPTKSIPVPFDSTIITQQTQATFHPGKVPTVQKSLSCILPGGRIVTCNRGNLFICQLKPYWESTNDNSELLQSITNQKDFKNTLKRLKQSQSKYEFESSYLLTVIQESDQTKLKELFAISHNLPSSIPTQQPSAYGDVTNLSNETNNLLVNQHNANPLVEQCLASGNYSAALAISYLIGNQNDFISALLPTLHSQPPSGLLRIILGIHLSKFSFALLDQSTVCNWWKEIIFFLLQNDSIKHDYLVEYLFNILYNNNRIASSIIQLIFDAKFNSFLSIYSNPSFIHSFSLENQLLNHFRQNGEGNFWFLKGMLDISLQQSLKYYNSYKWSQLTEMQQEWINEMLSIKSTGEKNVNGGGKWNFKIPSVMDVVDRVFIGSDEQTSSTTVEPKKQEIVEHRVEEPPQKPLPFQVTPPFNSGKQQLPTGGGGGTLENIQPVVPPLRQTDSQISLSNQLHQASSADLIASENDNFQSPILKPVESPELSSSPHNLSQLTLDEGVDHEQVKSDETGEKKTSYFGMLKGIFKSSKGEHSSSQSSISQRKSPTATHSQSGKDSIVKANLGEENTFVYDPVLKVWRDRNQPINESTESLEPTISAPPMPVPSPASLPTGSKNASSGSAGKASKSRYVAVL